MTDKVTIKTLARMLNISVCTVSKALSGKPRISEQTREKVIKLANELGYTPNYAAQALSRSDINIGIIYCGIYDSYYVPIVDAIKSCLDSLSHMRYKYTEINTSFFADDSSLSDFILKKENIKLYVILANDRLFADNMQNLIDNTGVPVITIGDDLKLVKNRVSYISQDSQKCGFVAAELLYNMSAIENVVVFAGTLKSRDNINKVDGFKSKAKELGAKNIYILDMENDNNIEYNMTCDIMSGNKITGIYASTDIVEGVVRYLTETESHAKLVSTGTFPYIKQMLDRHIINFTIDQQLKLQGEIVVSVIDKYFKSNKIDREILITPSVKTAALF